jgi:hypothetical protein
MNLLAALMVLGVIAAATALCWPAARRTGLGVWHPALAWLALHTVFFGVGSARLALDGRPGPALYVAGAALAFGTAVALSDRLARRRAGAGPDAAVVRPAIGLATRPASEPRAARDGGPLPADTAPLRPLAVAALAALGLLLVLPTLARVGLPFLVEDITGARSELAGPDLQLLRVAVPALALAIVLGSRGRPAPWLAVSGLIALEIALASRYLAAELIAVLFVGIGLAGWRLRPRLVLAGAFVAILAFGGIQVLRAYDQAAGRELAFALERTVNRVVLVQPRTLEALQSAIPAEQPYFAGLTWLRRLGPVLGRPEIPNLGYWVYPRIFPGQGPPGYAAPGLIGEAWANFGPLGLGLFGLLGVAAERLGVFLWRRQNATGDLIAGTLALVFLARTHALGLNGLAFLLLLVAIWRVLAAGGRAGTRGAIVDTVRWRA